MKKIALAILLVAVVAAPAAAQRKETETIDRTVPFSNGGTVKLQNFSGDARITGTSSNEVVVHAIRKGTREQLDNIKLDISRPPDRRLRLKRIVARLDGTARRTTSSRRNSRSRCRPQRHWTFMPSPAT
jgi:hypothetical protein